MLAAGTTVASAHSVEERQIKQRLAIEHGRQTGSITWLESQEELDHLLPPYKQWQRRMARWVRKVI